MTYNFYWAKASLFNILLPLYFYAVKKVSLPLLLSILLIQPSLAQLPTKIKQTAPPLYNTHLLISYQITIVNNTNSGIAETYNGGIKTIFIKNNLARLRLVSLMRTQSIFYNTLSTANQYVASIVKESGTQKTRMNLTAKQWKKYQQKNTKNICTLLPNDTATILNKLCKKAIITQADSTKLTLYYYPTTIHKTLAAAEPLFSAIPGIVLQYSVAIKASTITYTATVYHTKPIARANFAIPTMGYKNVKLSPTQSNGVSMGADEDDEVTEEVETEVDSTLSLPATLPMPPR